MRILRHPWLELVSGVMNSSTSPFSRPTWLLVLLDEWLRARTAGEAASAEGMEALMGLASTEDWLAIPAQERAQAAERLLSFRRAFLPADPSTWGTSEKFLGWHIQIWSQALRGDGQGSSLRDATAGQRRHLLGLCLAAAKQTPLPAWDKQALGAGTRWVMERAAAEDWQRAVAVGSVPAPDALRGRGTRRETLLHHVAAVWPEAMGSLLAAGADPDSRDGRGRVPAERVDPSHPLYAQTIALLAQAVLDRQLPADPSAALSLKKARL